MLTSVVHCLSEPLLSLCEHLLVDVEHVDRHVPVGVLQPGVVEDPLGNVSGSSCDVEALPSFAASSSRVEGGHERVLPQPVDPERHRVVHHVVRGRDRREHTPN